MREKIFANILVVLAIVFFLLMTVIWGLMTPSFLALAVLMLLAYWRLRVFPVTGFQLIKYWAIYGSYGVLGGFVIGYALAVVCWKLGMQMHHGFSFVVIFGIAFLGLISGILIGYSKYRNKKITVPSCIVGK